MTMPAKDNAIPNHCIRWKWSPFTSQRAPSTTKNGASRERDRPGRRCVKEAAVDQQEFEGEQHPGNDSRQQSSVALEQGNAAKLRPGDDQNRGDNRTDRRLDQRRDIMDRELDRDLIESPDQAKRDGEGDREWIKRAGLGGMLHEFSSIPMRRTARMSVRQRPRRSGNASPHRSRQWEQMPAISITGLLGTNPAARRGSLERFRDVAAGRLADRTAAFADQKDDEVGRRRDCGRRRRRHCGSRCGGRGRCRAENRARDRP